MLIERKYYCPHCDINFVVYHTDKNEYSTHCVWCKAEIEFLSENDKPIYDKEGKKLPRG